MAKDNVALFRVGARAVMTHRQCQEQGRINFNAPARTAQPVSYRYAPEEEPRPDQTIRSEKQERRRA